MIDGVIDQLVDVQNNEQGQIDIFFFLLYIVVSKIPSSFCAVLLSTDNMRKKSL